VSKRWIITVHTVQGTTIETEGIPVEGEELRALVESAWGDPAKPVLVFAANDDGFILVPRDQIQYVQVRRTP
jgi:hypothetical protein